jgi:hypothetical protein
MGFPLEQSAVKRDPTPVRSSIHPTTRKMVRTVVPGARIRISPKRIVSTAVSRKLIRILRNRSNIIKPSHAENGTGKAVAAPVSIRFGSASDKRFYIGVEKREERPKPILPNQFLYPTTDTFPMCE